MLFRKKTKKPWGTQPKPEEETHEKQSPIEIIEVFSPKPGEGRPWSVFGTDAPAMYITEAYEEGRFAGVEIYFSIIPGDYPEMEKQEFFREFRRFMSDHKIEIEEIVDFGDNIAQDRELSFCLSRRDWYLFSMQSFYSQLVEWVRSSEQRIDEIPDIPESQFWQEC